MKKRILIFLIAIISSALCSQQGLSADFISQCTLDVPNNHYSLMKQEISESPIIITSNFLKEDYPISSTFIGDVNINQGNSHLQADKMQLYQKKVNNNSSEPIRTIDAIGNVRYYDNKVILKGQKAWFNLNTKDANVWKGSYQFVERKGHGKADLIKQRNENRYTILDNGSFTSCLLDSNIWSVIGSKIIYDREEQIAKIWNARFKLGIVPILYSPYLQLPIGNKRRSGFLIPNVQYSAMNSFEFYLPYYLNIMSNVDATITPHYLHKHGNIVWENELRYLTQVGTNIMQFYYLPSDKVFKRKCLTKNNHHHWLYNWKHSSMIDQVWHFNIDYTKTNDPYYLNDFSSQNYSNFDRYFTQMFHMDYSTENFSAAISKRDFQIFSNQHTKTYSAEPQLDVNWYINNTGPLNISVYGQAVRFVNSNTSFPEAKRVHLEPTIDLPYSVKGVNVDTEMKLMVTHYKQKKINSYNQSNQENLKESINRMLPQLKVKGKLIFEHNVNLKRNYTQTIEPIIQYLFIPYRNQSEINKYDSVLLQPDYKGLFRDRIYSGLDRISSANQVTSGVTSRIFDNDFVERFNISIGQIYCLTNSCIKNNKINWENNDKTGPIVWASDVYWRISNRKILHGSVQYDIQMDNITTGNVSLKYFHNKNRMMQLTYHYDNPKYIQTILLDYDIPKQYIQGISQVRGETSWSIANHFSFSGSYYFDTNTRKVNNEKLWLQYDSCCYMARIGYEHKLNRWNINSSNSKNKTKYNNVIALNIELRGLGSNNNLGT